MKRPALAHILALATALLAVLAASALWIVNLRPGQATTVFKGSLALSAVLVVGYCGPLACFASGNNRLMGWLFVGGVAAPALLHHIVLNRFTPVTDHGR